MRNKIKYLLLIAITLLINFNKVKAELISNPGNLYSLYTYRANEGSEIVSLGLHNFTENYWYWIQPYSDIPVFRNELWLGTPTFETGNYYKLTINLKIDTGFNYYFYNLDMNKMYCLIANSDASGWVDGCQDISMGYSYNNQTSILSYYFTYKVRYNTKGIVVGLLANLDYDYPIFLLNNPSPDVRGLKVDSFQVERIEDPVEGALSGIQNSMDEQNKLQEETNNKLDNIENSLTDETPPDLSVLENSAGWLPPGPLDTILTLPLALLNNLTTNLNKQCNPVIVELPFVEENITLPCITTLYEQMGVLNTIFQTAGIVASAFILYNYLLKLYKWVDDTLTLRENTMPGYFDDNWGGGA